jgi:hypothetical protein
VTSARRRDANRRNARSSTGPRTSAGKARAAQNARRHGLSVPARYDPSRWDEIEALARTIVGLDADPERLELARRIAEAHIDIIRARSARRDLFPTSPAALLAPAAIARLAAIDRYERSAWSRRKRAIRALDDARSIERAGDDAGHLAERSQSRHLAERSQRELAERSQREAFRVENAARHFGRTKPMAAVSTPSSVIADRSILRLRPSHQERTLRNGQIGAVISLDRFFARMVRSGSSCLRCLP